MGGVAECGEDTKAEEERGCREPKCGRGRCKSGRWCGGGARRGCSRSSILDRPSVSIGSRTHMKFLCFEGIPPSQRVQYAGGVVAPSWAPGSTGRLPPRAPPATPEGTVIADHHYWKLEAESRRRSFREALRRRRVVWYLVRSFPSSSWTRRIRSFFIYSVSWRRS